MKEEAPAQTPQGSTAPPEGDESAPGVVGDFLRAHEQRRRHLPRAIVLGVLAGATAVAFTRSLVEADRLRTQFIAAAHSALGAFGIFVPVLIGATGGALALWLVRRFAPEAAGSGIPHLKGVLFNVRELRSVRVLVVKFLGGLAGIGGGFALGREGPTIQMGGALGQLVSRWFRCNPRETQTLLAAGAGAGLAAAFNAPLSGLVFVLEELQRDFAPTVFTVTLVASATADVVARLLNGQMPVFHVQVEPIPALQGLPVSLVVGLVAAVLGIAFNRSLVRMLDLFQGLRSWPSWVPGAVAGAMVGVVGWFLPEALGGGHRLVEQTLSGQTPTAALPGLFGLRFGLTMVSYGCGAPGGIFAPLLVLGSELGLAIGNVAAALMPTVIDHPETYAVIGMAAYFSAIVRAPLTGVVLVVEMTGNDSLVLPLLVASLTAYGIADFLGDRPVYEALLERDLLRGEERPALAGTLLLDLTIEPGSPFGGRSVAEVGAPPGCVFVVLHRGPEEIVPASDTVLLPGDRATIVVAPSAAGAIAGLRRGASARH